MNWVIPANKKFYDVDGAFSEFGFVDWRQKAKYNVGDILYIYCTAPIKRIVYKTIVEKINIEPNEIVNDEKYWVDNENYLASENYVFTRLRLIEKLHSDLLSLDNLKKHGLKGAPQGPQKIRENLSEYLESCFNKTKYEIIYPESDIINLSEGKLTTVKINSFERNVKARQKCIEYYGVNCQVCNMNFEERYGQIGKSYIHVHHITPLYEIREEYEVDPIKDLIPVCPNCHAMLHANRNGKVLTVSELKKRLRQ